MDAIRPFDAGREQGLRQGLSRFLFFGGIFVVVVSVLLALFVLRPEDPCQSSRSGPFRPCFGIPDPTEGLRRWIAIGGPAVGVLAILASLLAGRARARAGGVRRR